MGSQSDWATMKHAADTLDALGIAHDDRIVSARRSAFMISPPPRAPMASRSSSRAQVVPHICRA
jgi:phosphoribosylcarboxyaminoimidazole (NCAIR) mutase